MEKIRYRKVRFAGRRGCQLENGKIEFVFLTGGGHIVRINLKGRRVNPYWTPGWSSIEPSKFVFNRHKKIYGNNCEARLLASIRGHNLCADFFGVPSAEEEKAGLTVHGEAPVTEWKVRKIKKSPARFEISYGCVLTVAQLDIERTIAMERGRSSVKVTEIYRNLSASDRPVTLCQHVTLGRPFLKKGVTLFDIPGAWSQVLPGSFGGHERLKPGAVFHWPKAPGKKGGHKDLRPAPAESVSGDFTASQFKTNVEDAWFTAFNPEQNVCFGYVFKRSDFPWLGNWEENYSRTHMPWRGRELTRGMEFSTSPFPVSRRQAVKQGCLHGVPCYRWIGGKSEIRVDYSIFITETPSGFHGTKQVQRKGRRIKITGNGGERITV